MRRAVGKEKGAHRLVHRQQAGRAASGTEVSSGRWIDAGHATQVPMALIGHLASHDTVIEPQPLGCDGNNFIFSRLDDQLQML